MPPSDASKYEGSAYAVGEGKRLYSAYNCVGCHAHGGGAIGPALMDAEWIYGSRPEQIYSDIVQGRPNGMPSFAGKIPDYQVWELVAYVRSHERAAAQRCCALALRRDGGEESGTGRSRKSIPRMRIQQNVEHPKP